MIGKRKVNCTRFCDLISLEQENALPYYSDRDLIPPNAKLVLTDGTT